MKRRVFHLAAALAVLVVRAPTPDLFCRVACDAAASEREAAAAAAPVESCHAGAVPMDPAPTHGAPCERQARPCALAAAPDMTTARVGFGTSQETASAFSEGASADAVLPVARGSVVSARPFRSPPAGIPSSVRRL